ncbi:MAG: AAA family ATPase [Candidatus Marinimicrobia bacterium]|nr:AAA family ATPase [Candidatus Neomarinimicrobiota bacterium]
MEYFELLGLTQEPFSNTPDPEFFYGSHEHKEALQRLEMAIRLKRGLSVILGSVGTGKTTLSRTLLKTFEVDREKYLFRLILDPNFQSEYEFVTGIMRVFEMENIPNSTIECKNALQNNLLKLGALEEKIPVLIIDEGQLLTPTFLEVLRTLLNYETNKQKLLQVVIFGQPELLTKIKKQPNFYDRIGLGYVINPLNHKDTTRLIKYRLIRAGLNLNRQLFNDSAIKCIYEYSKGSPRRIVELCHESLLSMIRLEQNEVDKEIVHDSVTQKEHWNALEL